MLTVDCYLPLLALLGTRLDSSKLEAFKGSESLDNLTELTWGHRHARDGTARPREGGPDCVPHFNLETPLVPPAATPTLELDAFRALCTAPPSSPHSAQLAVQVLLAVPPPGGGTAPVYVKALAAQTLPYAAWCRPSFTYVLAPRALSNKGTGTREPALHGSKSNPTHSAHKQGCMEAGVVMLSVDARSTQYHTSGDLLSDKLLEGADTIHSLVTNREVKHNTEAKHSLTQPPPVIL
ncbi:hypothetical protein DFH08DRAFT_810363 [Mycena albidolilacea]|uniref:Uncharacterized protein n=1 Tax=Mycena albidolilacea TaxID=1033008 RepID=A0AAD6ZYY9_9AGAR|nr:hypothetical protein DFH08DRAFT_810363 [Mycena albidolilacea]